VREGILKIQATGDRLFSRTPVTGALLKWIAIVTMLIDHISATGLMPDFMMALWMRRIGRLAFPIFCFLAAEALEHSRDTLRYAARLGIFALISEIPFDLCIKGQPDWSSANVFFTLAGAVFLVVLYQRAIEKEGYFLIPGAAIAVLILAELLQFDYGVSGIFLIWIFYGLRKQGWLRIPAAALYMLLVWDHLQLYALLALPLLLLYNGRKGETGLPGHFFYAFYPVHLLILYGIRCVL